MVKLDTWLGPLDHIIKLLVGFLYAIKSRRVCDILHLLLIKLVMEALKLVSERGLRPSL